MLGSVVGKGMGDVVGAILVSDGDKSCLGMGIRGSEAGRGFAIKGRREVGEARSGEEVSFKP